VRDFTESKDFIEVDIYNPVMWNVVLTDEEIDAIANGCDPETIQPDHIVRSNNG